jgi:Undecaprenyl-phosphate glucose phosphotransferase
MIQTRSRNFKVLFIVSDLVMVFLAYFGAFFLRFSSGLFEPQRLPNLEPYLLALPFIAFLWPWVFHTQGLYKPRGGRSGFDELFSVFKGTLLSGILLFGIDAYVRHYREKNLIVQERFQFSRIFVLLFLVLTVFLVSTGRNVIRSRIEAAHRKGKFISKILIAGAGSLGTLIAEKILAHSELGLKVVGFLDDDPEKRGAGVEGIPVLGTLAELPKVLSEERVDALYIALPPTAHGSTMALIETAGRECVKVRLVPDILQFIVLHAGLEEFDGIPIIAVDEVPLQGFHFLLKRFVDIVFSVVVLAVLSPVMLLTALAIYLTTRGPVFYIQERMGLDGNRFKILKFRTMKPDAEAETGPVWAVDNDPRCTRLGTVLRRTSLDELPQFVNVLKGDMSIVGPRPERPNFVLEFKEKVPQYMLRHKVKSGITGWAQVNGWRGNTSIQKRIEHDLYYVENWSISFDLKIMWLTLWKGLMHRNAY